MLADSEESVESDEDFYFVDDNKFPSPKKKKASRPNAKSGSQNLKVTVKGPEEASVPSEVTGPPSGNGDSDDFKITKPDDFARMMATFDGFNQNSSSKVRSYKNRLFEAAHPEDVDKEVRNSGMTEVPKLNDKTPGTNAPSNIGDAGGKLGATKEPDEDVNVDTAPADSCPDGISSGLKHHFDSGKSNSSGGSTETLENRIYVNISTVMTNGGGEEINADDKSPEDSTDARGEEKKDLSETNKSLEDVGDTELDTGKQRKQKSKKTGTSSRKNGKSSSQESSKSSSPSKSPEKSQDTYITVLPGPVERPDESHTKNSSESDSHVGKTGISRSKCLSYLVVSAGEGHADFRLKVKSKQDLKKDAQSMFLIWRVNSKV